MDDIPWPYVVVIFIAFVSWLFNKIQEASAAKKQKRFERVKHSWEQREEEQPQQQQRTQPVSKPPPIPPSTQRVAEPFPDLEVPPVKRVKVARKSTARKRPVRKPVRRKTSNLDLDMREILGSSVSVKQMLIASEILGKPKGLQ